MGVLSWLRGMVDGPPPKAWGAEFVKLSLEDEVDKLIHSREHPRAGAWRMPTVAEALGVPPILRAVTLISSTTGMLSMQGYRNGAPMPEAPRLITRPDPDEPPGVFYEETAGNLAKYGEFVWWIASRDSDGLPAALVNVPLAELRVEDNQYNRRRPVYRWGDIVSTRWTPVNQAGAFVHRKYAGGDPLALRGEGPLQRAKAAVSISVESQTWAANFYGDGGKARDIIKHASSLDPTLRDEQGLPDAAGLSEADRLRTQYTNRNNNTPLIIDQSIESITHPEIDEAGAQMLESRIHQRGDAALIFGMPGHFVEYVQSGTSLTYQTLETAFTELVMVCLAPLYLEPIEQAMSDLLTRSTVARFNVKGFLRADIKTRFEVHGIAIDKGIYDATYAQREEGILPGDVEYAPVPYAPPAVAPPMIPRFASREVRCDGTRMLHGQITGCGRLLAQGGTFVGTCPRCKKVYPAAA
jgi:phage portal protein BeeE